MKKYAIFAGIGLELLVMMGILITLGQKIDQTYGFTGIFTIVGVVIGFVAWFAHLIYLLKQFNTNQK